VNDILHRLHHLRGLVIGVAALALSAGLAFGAEPPTSATFGLTNASEHAGKTVPVQAGQQDETTDEEVTEEETEEETTEESSEEAGENCSTDPTALTEEQLADLKHGQIVCWAAHQTEWPEWFEKHGDFVKCWAHNGKADAPSCTEDPAAEEPTVEEPDADADTDADATSAGHGKGNGKGNGKNKD
jgi:hypothetical protein